MPPAQPTAATVRSIQQALLGWYGRHGRDLPWRSSRDPYAIWVSEILLQQTRVSAGLPYYHRFLKRFPTVGALAEARLDDVLKCWEGLGYYSRARNLHQAAKLVVREHGGKLPSSADGLRQLPGIGPYTAGAIASIAFDRDEPVVDGNVIRILCRLFGIDADVTAARTKQRLWDLARRLLPTGRSGDFNQALMDLGATICRPAGPDCDACPLAKLCRARRDGTQARLPRKKKTKTLPHYDMAVGVIWKAGKVLIDRRPEQGLLGGLWEFPGGKVQAGESHPAAVVREVKEELGIDVQVLAGLESVEHAYSHFRVSLHFFTCRYVAGRCRPRQVAACKWVSPSQLEQYAFPSANREILRKLRDPQP